MSDRPTTLQLVGQEIADVLADDVRVLNDRATGEGLGGGDVDCAVRGLRPYWHLRLKDWRLCQALRYDVTATYYVLARGDETLALDVLDDPQGAGKYRLPTTLGSAAAEPGSLAPAVVRAFYLTLKRVVKGGTRESQWEEIATLAAGDPVQYRTLLARPLGRVLAAQVAGAVESGVVPPAHVLARSRRRLRRSRRSPVAVLRRARRVLHRLVHPTGLVVAVLGPDGAGKSTVAEALPEACGQLFRRSLRIHFRPGVLPRPGAVVGRPMPDSARPQERKAHGAALSMLLLAYHWLDALAGHVLRVVPARARTGLVIVERGFLDIAVDPLRYRLDVSTRLARALARLLPAPDLTIFLDAPAETIAARKAELPEAEIARQSAAWRALLDSVRAVRVDSSQPLPEMLADVRGHVVDHLAERVATTQNGGWATLPARTHELFVPRTATAISRAALDMEAPSKTTSRLALRVARVGVGTGLVRALPAVATPAAARRALAPHLPSGCTFALRRGVHPNRYLALVLDRRGTAVAFAKVATDDAARARLLSERAGIEERAALLSPPLAGPRLFAADESVVVLEWVQSQPRRRPWFLPPEVAHGLGSLFAAGGTVERGEARGPAHGDMAPWNLLRTTSGWVLVDWEVSLADAPPFFDVFHFVVQGHSFLAHPSRRELFRGIAGEGWVGNAVAAYAEGAGLPYDLAQRSFERYLEHTSASATMRDMSPEAISLRQDLMAEMGA